MIPLNPCEYQNAIKTFYSKCVEMVCQKHDLTRIELDILLFLANNPIYDTASDIVEIRFLSKSQVSVAIRLLEQKGFLAKTYADHNRKTVHLNITEEASSVIADGKAAQEAFISAIFYGIPQTDLDAMKRCSVRMIKNIRQYLKEENE